MKIWWAILGAIVILSGCATTAVWEAAGKSTVTIDRVTAVRAGDDRIGLSVSVFGRRESPIIPGLKTTSCTGIVDRLSVAGEEVKIVVRVDSFQAGELVQPGLEEVSRQDFAACPQGMGQCALQLHQDGAFLLADLAKWRSYLVVPILKESMEDGKALWTVKVLDEPWIAYRKRSYASSSSIGLKVAQRIAFVPFALVADAVTLPAQVICGLFGHM